MYLLNNFNNSEIYLLIYIFSINLTAFLMFAIDKFKSKNKKWRIPEIHLIFLSLIGGGVGSIIAMVIFKHKLYKKRFSLGIPILIILNSLLFIFILNKIK